MIITFDRDTVRAVKQMLPGYKVYLLMSIDRDKISGKPEIDPEGMIQTLREVGADGVDCCAHDFIDRDWVSRVKQAGFEFHVWTIDDTAVAKSFIDRGVDSITSNCAYILSQEVK